MMTLQDLINKGCRLEYTRTTYRGGSEYLSITFVDPKTWKRFRVSISAERGSDLLVNVKESK